MKIKNKLFTNVIAIALIEVCLTQLGYYLENVFAMLALQPVLQNPGPNADFIIEAVCIVFYIFQILLRFMFMCVANRGSLKIFSMGTVGKRIKNAFLGLLTGIVINAIFSGIVCVSGSVTLSFNGFSWPLIAILPFSLFWILPEEMALRGMLPAFLEGTHRWDVVAFAGGVLMIFHYVPNITRYGFSAIFCLNVFLISVAFYLMLKLTRSFWFCCGIHTGWNFTQQYLFGLPNSGQCSGYALFQGKDAADTFFFDPVYGNEGSLFCLVFWGVLILLLLWRINKRSKEGKDLLGTPMIEQ